MILMGSCFFPCRILSLPHLMLSMRNVWRFLKAFNLALSGGFQRILVETGDLILIDLCVSIDFENGPYGNICDGVEMRLSKPMLYGFFTRSEGW